MAERWLQRFAEKITRKLDNHEERLRGVERKPQLHRAALHDGSVDEYSGKKLVSVIGKQFDGGHGVVVTSDPEPPVSSPANVVAGPESIAVQVPGTFVDPETGETDISIPWPTYASRYEVHVSLDPDFSALFADTLKGTIDSPRGGWHVVSPLEADKTHYVRIMVRSKSGKASPEASAVVEVVPRPKLQPGDLNGKHITGTTFTTRNSRGLWSDDGLFIFREDGTVRIALPTDDSPPYIDAELIARSLTSLGSMAIRGLDNEIASGSNLMIAAGVSAPSSPPSVSMTYPALQLPELPANTSAHGVTYSGGLLWRSVNIWNNALDVLEGYDNTGTMVERHEISGGGPLYGLTSVGGILYMLYKDTWAGTIWVRGYDPATGRSTSHWQFPADTKGGDPAIGTNGTNILIAQCWPEGQPAWWEYDPTSGILLKYMWSEYNLASDLVGVHIGTADYGVERVTITKKNGTTEIFQPDGIQIPYGGWYSKDRADHAGMCWDGTNFRGLTPTGEIVTYSHIWDLGGDTNDWWLANTWVDDQGRETTVGPPQRFTLKRRATLTVGAPQVPVGAVEARLYLDRAQAAPIAETYRLIGAGTGVTHIDDLGTWETAAQSPSVNEIPDSQPGWFWSQRGAFYVDGVGAGGWGPFTFNADGTASIDHDTVQPTSTAVTFANGWINYPGYNALAVEKVAAGRVLLAGMIQPGGTSFDTKVGTITDDRYWPTVKQFLPCTINDNGAENFFSGVVTVEPNGDIRQRGFPSATSTGYLIVNAEYKII